MDRQAASILAPYLARDERLLWAGRPNALHYASAGMGWRFRAGVAVLFIVMATGAGFWLQIIAWPQELIYQITIAIGAFILALGAMHVLAVPLGRYVEAKHVAYGLSERRAIIIVEGSHSRIAEFPLSSLDKPRRLNINADLATILLGNNDTNDHEYRRSFAESRSRAFIAVRNAEALMERLNELQADQTVRSGDRPE